MALELDYLMFLHLTIMDGKVDDPESGWCTAVLKQTGLMNRYLEKGAWFLMLKTFECSSVAYCSHCAHRGSVSYWGSAGPLSSRELCSPSGVLIVMKAPCSQWLNQLNSILQIPKNQPPSTFPPTISDLSLSKWCLASVSEVIQFVVLDLV